MPYGIFCESHIGSMMHLYCSRWPQCSPTVHIWNNQAHYRHTQFIDGTWNINIYTTSRFTSHRLYTFISHTLIFTVLFHILHVQYRRLVEHFATIICCVSTQWEVENCFSFPQYMYFKKVKLTKVVFIKGCLYYDFFLKNIFFFFCRQYSILSGQALFEVKLTFYHIHQLQHRWFYNWIKLKTVWQ